ncbi:MFS transporter [Nocardia sp. NBC_00508]|uniref:MFS transporter n=1 Tax=Nocardia sp. NBC_00508 TaxID=2975992 RepID=UPI002E807019|nr:MFS transporter [Nocardia sp. NBC_00508]WUD69202.1 MFS transporter [Nocardia sp. NBC_00508]
MGGPIDLGIVLVGATLRAPLTSVGPLMPVITGDTGLSSAYAGLLTALPLLIFAVVPVLVLRTVHHGPERLVRLALVAMLVGLVVRSTPGQTWLFAGTAVIAVAIGFANVLLPAIVRGSVSSARVTAVTGAWVAAMCAAAAVSSGIAVPLADVLPGGWRQALAATALLTVAALLVWRLRTGPVAEPLTVRRVPMPWRSALAWQVSAFMGLQALGFYTTLAWLPSILHDNGVTPRTAGWSLFVFQILGLAVINAMPWLTRTAAAKRWLAVAASVLDAAGFLLLALAPSSAPLAIFLLGAGAGACLAMAMAFQSERAGDIGQAAALAAMAQTVGFAMAAAGPTLVGVLHTRTHGWAPALVALTAMTLVQAAAAAGAGRSEVVRPDRHVGLPMIRYGRFGGMAAGPPVTAKPAATHPPGTPGLEQERS